MSKQNTKPSKKGLVVNRRHNRTLAQGVVKSEPKWVDIGGGILKLRGPDNQTAYIALRGGKFVSLTRKAVDIAHSPKATQGEKVAA